MNMKTKAWDIFLRYRRHFHTDTILHSFSDTFSLSDTILKHPDCVAKRVCTVYIRPKKFLYNSLVGLNDMFRK